MATWQESNLGRQFPERPTAIDSIPNPPEWWGEDITLWPTEAPKLAEIESKLASNLSEAWPASPDFLREYLGEKTRAEIAVHYWANRVFLAKVRGYDDDDPMLPQTVILSPHVGIRDAMRYSDWAKRRPELAPTFIGLGVHIAPGAQVYEGAVLDHSVILDANATIGEKTHLFENVHVGISAIVGSNCKIGPDCVIGNRCETGDRAIMAADSHLVLAGYLCDDGRLGWHTVCAGSIVHPAVDANYRKNPDLKWGKPREIPGTVGALSFVGKNAVVLDYVGNCCFIAIGAHVTKPVGDWTIVTGDNKQTPFAEWKGARLTPPDLELFEEYMRTIKQYYPEMEEHL